MSRTIDPKEQHAARLAGKTPAKAAVKFPRRRATATPVERDPRQQTPVEEKERRKARLQERRWSGMTLAEAGALEDPPISKERVYQILGKEPGLPGRPARSDPSLISRRLRDWEERRAAATTDWERETLDAKITALRAELADAVPSEVSQPVATMAEADVVSAPTRTRLPGEIGAPS